VGLLLNSLISACALTSHTPNDYQACDKATHAGLQQLGIIQQVDGMEDKQVKNIERIADNNLGKNGEYAIIGAYFVARTLQTKSVGFGLPTLGLCSSVRAEIGENESLMRFEWRF
jgi:hypothetical protein